MRQRISRHSPPLMLLCVALLAGCASAPQPRKTTLGERIAAEALAQTGRPYRYGGSTPEGFDCSGLGAARPPGCRIDVPRTTTGQFRVARSIRGNKLAPGDLLFPHRFPGSHACGDLHRQSTLRGACTAIRQVGSKLARWTMLGMPIGWWAPEGCSDTDSARIRVLYRPLLRLGTQIGWKHGQPQKSSRERCLQVPGPAPAGSGKSQEGGRIWPELLSVHGKNRAAARRAQDRQGRRWRRSRGSLTSAASLPSITSWRPRAKTPLLHPAAGATTTPSRRSRPAPRATGPTRSRPCGPPTATHAPEMQLDEPIEHLLPRPHVIVRIGVQQVEQPIEQAGKGK